MMYQLWQIESMNIDGTYDKPRLFETDDIDGDCGISLCGIYKVKDMYNDTWWIDVDCAGITFRTTEDESVAREWRKEHGTRCCACGWGSR